MSMSFSSAYAESILTEEDMVEKSRLYHIAIEWFDARYDETMDGDFYFDDAGNLVLNIVPEKFTLEMKNDLEKCNEFLSKNALTKSGIRTVEVKYTLAELKTIQKKMVDYFKIEGFNSIDLDTINNQIVVHLPESLPHPRKALFSTEIPVDAITIVYEENGEYTSGKENLSTMESSVDVSPLATYTNVVPGTAGYNGGGYCTFSWGLQYKGKYCYLFAGHGADVGDSIFYNGQNIGKTIYSKVDGRLDCAIVERFDSYKTISSFLPNGSRLPYSSPKRDYKANDTIWMYGARSARRSGVIESCSSTVYYDGHYISDIILATYYGTHGDSGAPVYYSNTAPLGIHVAYSGNLNRACVVKLHNIIDETGASLYDF